MIEKIRLEDNQEVYVVDVGDRTVVVILCLNGEVVIKDRWSSDTDPPLAKLSQYETFTYSQAYGQLKVLSSSSSGADFLIVRYFRS
jgi:hypothetical protein